MRIQDLSAFRLPAGFRGRSAVVVQLWWLVQATAFRWSPQVFYAWRRMLLRLFGAKIGKNAIIRPTATFTYPWKISIGDYSWIGDDAVLYSLGPISIGANAVISQGAYLCGGSHRHNTPTFEIFSKAIHVGNEAWLASDVWVAPGVTIGDGCVVGARSSVFSDLPPMMICVGNPARPTKARLNDAAFAEQGR